MKVKKTWTLCCKSIHFVHFRFESFINAYFSAVITFYSTWRIIYQSACGWITITTTSTATLSISWSATEPTLIIARWAFVWIVLTFPSFVLTISIIVTVFRVLTTSITWFTASSIGLTVAKTSFPTGSANVVIPIQARSTNSGTLCI